MASPVSIAPQKSLFGLLASWHLLSLDAPTIATLWTLLIGRATHVSLPSAVLLAVFLGVWIVYTIDRLLDSRINGLVTGKDAQTDRLEARHLFHDAHRRAFTVSIGIATLVLVPLTLRIPAPMLKLYLTLGSLLAIWLGVIHLRAQRGAYVLPKELAVGLFFSAAVFTPAVSQIVCCRGSLLTAALLFALLCSVNCLFIYAWEHECDTASAHFTTRLALRRLLPATALLVLAPLLYRFAALPLLIAISLAAALLLLLDGLRLRFHRTTLRVAADLALLTPLLVLPLLW